MGKSGKSPPKPILFATAGWNLRLPRRTNFPDRWFGYDAVDLLILNAADPAFWEEIAKDKGRCRAIAEWVRRGGRILICGGAGSQIHHIFGRDEAFPFRIDQQAERPVNEIAMVLPNTSSAVVEAANEEARSPFSPLSPIPIIHTKPSCSPTSAKRRIRLWSRELTGSGESRW